MRSRVRVVLAGVAAAASVTCSDHSVTGTRRAALTRLALAPVFEQAAPGGPALDVTRMRAVLRSIGGTDSAVAESPVVGDSAILEFDHVVVRGDSALFALAIRAFDEDGVLIFEGSQNVSVRPGDNRPAAPTLDYTAPDVSVANITIAPASASLQWAGAAPGDVSCLNREPSDTAHTQVQLSVAGVDDNGAPVPDVRVGWSTTDSTVLAVDVAGLVSARCANKSAFIVARTFLGKTDSMEVTVAAPPFALEMSPESLSVSRDDSVAMMAVFIDEVGNPMPAGEVSWASSDTSRATVSSTGVVRARTNGRVLITARSGSRETVGVVQVVRPRATRVEITPAFDSIAVSYLAAYTAVAYDKFGRAIPDAGGYAWSSSSADIAAVSPFGAVAGRAAGTANIVARLDDAADTATVNVVVATTGGVRGRVVDGATGAPLAAAFVSQASNPNNVSSTDADGRFALAGLAPGENIVVVKDAYAAVTQYALRIVPARYAVLADIPMAIAGGTGTISGHVVNALNDAAVAGAAVKLFADIEPRSSDPSSGVSTPAPVAQTTTDASGNFTFTGVASGTYTQAVEAAGFAVTRPVTVAIAGGTTSTRVVLTPTLSSGIRVVLTWGDCAVDADVPCDLDSHLTGPLATPDTGRFHVAYFQRQYLANGTAVATLDNDASAGPGPETVTLQPVTAGVYKFYVHDYSTGFDTSSTRLSGSHARVDVYSGSALVGTFYPPTGGVGTVWAVFEYDGSSVLGIGQMVRVQDFTGVPSDFLRADGPADTVEDRASLVRDLRRAPVKPR